MYLKLHTMNKFTNKSTHYILLLFFFFSLSNAIPLENDVPISLDNSFISTQRNEQAPEQLIKEFGIKDINEFMRQVLDPMPTVLPQIPNGTGDREELKFPISEETTEMPIVSDEFESDEQFFQENIIRDPEEFFITIGPTPTPPLFFARGLPSFCNKRQIDCLLRQRCGVFVFRRSTNRRLNGNGKRLQQICRRKCRIKSQTCWHVLRNLHSPKHFFVMMGSNSCNCTPVAFRIVFLQIVKEIQINKWSSPVERLNFTLEFYRVLRVYFNWIVIGCATF